jgi:alanine dehydrogenase
MKPAEKLISFSSEKLMPQPEMLEVGRKSAKLTIGIPKETEFQERRICLAPDAVAVLSSHGHNVVVETGAGGHASFSDNDYSEAGAKIAYDSREVFESNLVLKVHPPTEAEIELMKPKTTLISALQLKVQNKRYFELLMKKKITALAFDYMEDEDGHIPVVRSMSEIAGNTAILIAAELLSNVNEGKGLMLGGLSGVNPTNVVILGAGTVGEYATRAALGLGASVLIFDKSISKLRRLQDILFTRMATSVVQPKVLEKALKRADVVIGAVRATEGRTPCIVTEEMVQGMKPGSVIVDVSIDQGGCFETSEVTTHENPTYKKYGIVHYCVPNIASRVSRTASFSLSNIFLPTLVQMGEEGGVEQMIRQHVGVRSGLYIYHGTLTNRGVGEWFELPYKNIDLIFSAW